MKLSNAAIAGALVALIGWWPLAGAFGALFWPKVFDAEGPDDIAVRTLLSDQDQAIYKFIRHGPAIGKMGEDNCSWKFGVASYRLNDLGSPAVSLNESIHFRRNWINSQIVNSFAQKSLHDLPNIALGALQGCVQGSLLAGVCRDFVGRRLTEDLEAHRRAVEDQTNANDAKAIEASCAALKGTRWP